jgi:Fe2+ or Zn2+ uptake regulation protein
VLKGGFWIHLTCDDCGTVQEFTKANQDKAIKAAKAAGWNLTRYTGSTGTLCKNCYTPIYTMADLRVARLAKKAQGRG